MQAAARVLEVSGERAQLACESTATVCSACAGRGGCALQRLAGRGDRRLEVPARTADGGRLVPGSRVSVEVEDGALVAAAGRAYLPPLAGLLAVPLLARAVIADGGEGVLLLAAVTGLLIGWAAARAWLRRSPPPLVVRIAEGPSHAG